MRIVCCTSLTLLFLFCGMPAEAQDKSSLVLQGSTGARDGVIENLCRGGAQQSLGGSFHYYVTKRTSIGPEVLWLSTCSQNFTYYAPRVSGMVQFTHDFADRRLRPYVLGGIGIIHHQSQYAPSQNKFDAAAGGGVKIFVSKQVFVTPIELLFGAGAYGTFRYSLHVGVVLR